MLRYQRINDALHFDPDFFQLALALLRKSGVLILNIELRMATLSTRSKRMCDITHYLGFGCSPESDMVAKNKI